MVHVLDNLVAKNGSLILSCDLLTI